MSPTVLRHKNYRLLFFSKEENRIHIHISSPDGEAKFWIEPEIELAENHGLSQKQINEIKKLIEENENDIRNAWQDHFSN